MKKVAVAHLKGGVGKTTTAVTLARLAAAAGHKTLLLDLDAQGSAGYLLRVDTADSPSAKAVAKAKKSLTDFIAPTIYPKLHVLPGAFSFRKLPQVLAGQSSGDDPFREIFKRLGKGYDLLIIDAPAGLTYESEAILKAVDLVVVPVVPTPLSLQSFSTLQDFVREKTGGKRGKPAKLVGFYSMVDRRRKLHRQIVDHALAAPSSGDLVAPGDPAASGDPAAALVAAATDLPRHTAAIWPLAVPNSAAVERMTTERLPLSELRRPGPALAAYRELWTRIAAVLTLH